VEIDDRDLRGAEKNWSWIKRGIPIRLEVGPRDVAASSVMMARRDQGPRAKRPVAVDELLGTISSVLDEIQSGLFSRALAFREEHTHKLDDWADLVAFFTPKDRAKPEIHGGFAMAHWCGERAVEEQANELKVTIRCIPLAGDDEPGRCILTGRPSRQRVLFAKAY